MALSAGDLAVLTGGDFAQKQLLIVKKVTTSAKQKELVPVLAKVLEAMGEHQPFKINKRPKDDVDADESKAEAESESKLVAMSQPLQFRSFLAVAVKPKNELADDSKEALDTKIKDEIDNLEHQTKDFIEKKEICADFHLVIFVHGFNNDYNARKKRNARIDQALDTNKVVTTWFNWKSVAGVFGALYYDTDKKVEKALAEFFAGYITLIRSRDIFRNVKVHIIAHSMGCQLLCDAIDYQTKHESKPFDNCSIVCMAADVELEEYKERTDTMKSAMDKSGCIWSHFYNDKAVLDGGDKALAASNIKNGTDARAGQASLGEDSLAKSIECPELPILSIGHGYIDSIFDVKNEKCEEVRATLIKRLGL